MPNATKERKGRRLDGTPNKVISEKIVERHDDGTVTYAKVYNDDDGVRHTNTERRDAKKRGGGGRSMDLTPNREFTARRKGENPDGTVTYVIPYNDENGVRHEREEIREKGTRGGHRKPDASPSRIISSIKSERIANSNGEAGTNIVMSVPYNDKEGNRMEGYVVLSVNSKGDLSVKTVQDKPDTHVRQRKTTEDNGVKPA